MVAQHHQAAQRRAGHHGLLPRAQKAHVRDMEPVHILGRINRVDDQIAVQMFRQRQLHEDAMHRRIGVQLGDQRQQISLGSVGGQLVFKAVHPGLMGLHALVADVDLAAVDHLGRHRSSLPEAVRPKAAFLARDGPIDQTPPQFFHQFGRQPVRGGVTADIHHHFLDPAVDAGG